MAADMIVIPVDPAEPVRLVADDDQAVVVLRREIGAHRIDHSSFRTLWGVVQVWVADDSLRGDVIDHNLRAIALCRDHGYDVPDVGGVAVVTSYDPATGEAVDPPTELLDYLEHFDGGNG